MLTSLEHHYPYIIGVDTHAATHTFAVLDNTGVRHHTQTFPTTEAGIRRTLAWAGRRTGETWPHCGSLNVSATTVDHLPKQSKVPDVRLWKLHACPRKVTSGVGKKRCH